MHHFQNKKIKIRQQQSELDYRQELIISSKDNTLKVKFHIL